MKKAEIEWYPFPQEKPTVDDQYIVSIRLGKVSFTATADWKNVKGKFKVMFNENITAWAEMPRPYKEEA